MNISLKANVVCTDGPCGRATDIVVDPATRTVTNVAIEDKSLPENPTRLVPASDVAGYAADHITLSRTRAEIATRPPYIVADIIQESPSGQAYSSGDAYGAQYVVDDTAYDEVEERAVPQGELALRNGIAIVATDGRVGKLDELVLDETSGEVTDLVMRTGHLWGARDVTVPVDEIDQADSVAVYLKVDKSAIGTLPATKAERS